MNDYQFDEYVKALIAEEDIELPESVRERTEQTLASLPLRMPKRKPRIMRTVTSIAACMAILLLGSRLTTTINKVFVKTDTTVMSKHN